MSNILSSRQSSDRAFPSWLQLLRSAPFVASCIAHFGNNWGVYTLLMGTPLFLNNIHHFPIKAVRN